MQTWWYKKWVWSWIEEERLAELRDITSPSIAFHIRGGDIFEADKAQVRLLLLLLTVSVDVGDSSGRLP